MRVRNIYKAGGYKLPLLALAVAAAALLATLLASAGQTQAQSCTALEDLGTLRSHQTITRTGLLSAASPCRFEGVRYYDRYTFELSGAGSVSAVMASRDFDERVIFNTSSGEYLASDTGGTSWTGRTWNAELSRTLPAGQYRLLAISNNNERAGSYSLTVRTGRLTAPPPPPPPPVTTTNVDDGAQEGEQTLPPAETEVVRGYVLARVHPLPENDRRGAYRIEFGFLSQEVLASGTDRTAVVEANEHLLPPRRYLNESSMLERARDNNRNWQHSSPIDVLPLEGDDATLSGEPLLTGRVIARWNPTPGGRFRIEFGFLPEWAIEEAGGDTQRAAEVCADLLPDPGRYLTESRINSEARRSAPRWLTSSLVEIGEDGSCRIGPVKITPIAAPLTLSRGQVISDESIATINGDLAETFNPVTVTGLPPGLESEIAETSAEGREHQLTVSGTIPASADARNYSVQITAEGADGERATGTMTIRIEGDPLTIAWDGYTPASAPVDGSVTIISPRVTSPIPAPSPVTWRYETSTPALCEVKNSPRSQAGELTLKAEGVCQITVTASATGYAPDMVTKRVTITPLPIPTISWSGYSQSSVAYGKAAPTVEWPSATVNGRTIYPEYSYSVAATSASVCSVAANGSLTVLAVGECRVKVENVERPPEYGMGEAFASVQVDLGDPELSWDGYSPEMVQLGDSPPRPPRLLQPTAAARTIEFDYHNRTPNICRADSETGALTLVPDADGTCIVQVSTSGDPNYRPASTTATVTITAQPVITIGCSPSSFDAGQSTRCVVTSNRGGDIDRYSWSASGGSPSSGSSSTYSPRFSREGRYTVSLTASNSGGPGDASTTVTVDPPPPVITCSPDRPNVGETVTCTVRPSATQWVRHSWSSNGGSPSSGMSSTYRPRFDREGRYTVELTASTDSGSEKRSAPVTVDVQGVQPPQVSVQCPSSAGVNQSITCTWMLIDGGQPTSWSWSDSDGGSGSSSDYNRTFTSSGTKMVYLTASNDGGPGRRASDTVTVAVERPQVSIVSCRPSPANVNQSITCTGRLTGGDPATEWVWRDSDGGSYSDYQRSGSRSSSYRVTFTSSGSKAIRLTANNDDGSGRASATVNVRIPPPDITIGCSPSSIDEGESVTCRVTDNRGGAIDTYSWRAADGVPSRDSLSTYSPTFSREGRYTVSLTARNDGGDDSDSTTVRVVPPEPVVEPPVGHIWCPPGADVDSLIRCVWTWTDGDRPTTLSWRDSDGGSDSGSNYSVRFSSTGTKTIRLDVSNSGGSAAASRSVLVVAPPPSTQYARCGNDRIRVYYFERTTYTKRWVNMTWEQIAARVSGWGEHMIGHMSQSNCNSWPTGGNITTSNWPPPP